MKKFLRPILGLMLALGAITIISTPVLACTNGLTPGFWKNHTEIWTDDFGTDSFSDIFGVGPDISLMDCLTAKGGGENAFLRQAAAAWLNANYLPDGTYLTPAEVISLVQNGAYGSGTWSGMTGNMEFWKNYLESLNSLGYEW